MSPDAPAPFPWEAAMRFGLGRLRLPPDVFWAMTVPELAAAAAARQPPAPPPLDRAALVALSARFPDAP
jgi:uncharacterized phage protein (TIGR02216 family)